MPSHEAHLGYDISLDRNVVETLLPTVTPRIKVPETIRLNLRRYLMDALNEARGRREREKPARDRWRKVLAGENPEPRINRHASHLCVPLMMWATAAMRGRILQGVL